MADVRVELGGVRATMAHLATKSDLATAQSSLVRWLIGLGVTVVIALMSVVLGSAAWLSAQIQSLTP